MAPGSTEKQYLVVHESAEQFNVVGAYSSSSEAYTAALHRQIDVFRAIRDQVNQVLKSGSDQYSLECKLRMLQDAMESYFLDVGLDSLTDYFTVTDQPIAEGAPSRKRKMAVTPRTDSKMAKSNTSCGVASTTTSTLRTMARYMYQTSPFGMS